MTLTQATCDNCDAPLRYEFESKSYAITETTHRTSCGECSQSLSTEESFSFCNKKCAFEWLRRRA